MFADGGLTVAVQQPTSFSVTRLGASGLPDATFANLATRDFAYIRSVAFMPDGRFIVHHHSSGVPICHNWLSRHLPSGAPDIGYGSGGDWQQGGSRCSVHSNVVVNAAGEAYFSATSGTLTDRSAYVVRVNAAGTAADNLGLATGRGEPPPRTYGQLALQSDGRLVAVVTPGLAAARFSGAQLDPTFGDSGIASAQVPGGEAHSVVVQNDGSVVIAGIAGMPSRMQIAVARFTGGGRIDPAFGVNGVALIDVAKAGEVVSGAFLAMQPDGKLLVGGNVDKETFSPASFPRIVLGRLTTSGQVDMTFAPGGVFDLLIERGTGLNALGVRSDGRIVLATSVWTSFEYPNAPQTQVSVVQLLGGDAAPAGAIRQRKAVEYFHGGYGHYFLTADPEEIVILDRSSGTGWVRTGQSIDVWDGADASLTPVCRFWSDQTWSPKSSHFYTPYDTECTGVKNDPSWRFERNAFMVKLPQGTLGARTCPGDSQPLYRAYNNGLTGAPNHRYMTDPALLDALIAQGWTMEGEAQTRVFACVPVQ